jgi:hypothetical protein
MLEEIEGRGKKADFGAKELNTSKHLKYICKRGPEERRAGKRRFKMFV